MTKILATRFAAGIVLFFMTISVHAQVLVSYTKTYDSKFSKYKTYKVYGFDALGSPRFGPKEEGLNLAVAEINKQMISRGYKSVEENPELGIYLGVFITADEKSKEKVEKVEPVYAGRRDYDWEPENMDNIKYRPEGTLIFDLVNMSENTLIWQATVKSAILQERKKNEKKIKKAVNQLFTMYPIKSKT